MLLASKSPTSNCMPVKNILLSVLSAKFTCPTNEFALLYDAHEVANEPLV